MAKKTFDLGGKLADVLNVSIPDTGAEQIVRLPLAQIDADERNFYTVDAIDALAANIELVGLLDPIRVREDPEQPGRYKIVSGHRRAAALRLLAKDAPDKWSAAPCIIEAPAASPELQELRLIYANADTRRMTSAEISAQAERVEALLYALKEQGVEFPGRMRDHVAEACKVSATKIATLKVIRENLSEAWAKKWKDGKIAESVAYALAQLPQERQTQLYDATLAADDKRLVYESTVRQRDLDLSKIEAIMCKKTPGPCTNRAAMKEKLRTLPSWQSTDCDRCCSDCRNLISCKSVCPMLLEKQKRLKADRKEAKRQEELALAERNKPKIDFIRAIWTRWDEARRKAKMSVKTGYMICSKFYESKDDKQVAGTEKIVPGTTGLPYNYVFPASLQALIAYADKTGCSTDWLLGRTDDPAPAAPAQRTDAAALQFRSGEKPPETELHAWCVFDCGGAILEEDAVYVPHLQKWTFRSTGAGIDAICKAWYPLPEWEESK